MVDEKSNNNQVLSEITSDTLPQLNLKEILDKLTLQLLDITGFHICAIYQWDQENDRAITLADVGRAAWTKNEGERYSISDYPAAINVLATGQPVIVHVEMDDPETEWMNELGLVSMLMIPLYQKENIIGLAELANTEKFMFTAQEGLQMCEPILQNASEWLVSPLQDNPKEKLFSLAQELRDAINASACSFSTWLPETDEGEYDVDYANSFWDYGKGPTYPLKEWLIGRKVLDQKIPLFLVPSTPGITSMELKDLEDYNSLTVAIIPLSINDQPIGLIELYDVNAERNITNEELFSWGAIAGQATIAIQNAQLLQVAQQRLDEQIILRKATEVIVSSLESSEILTKLAEQLCIAIDATSAYISEYQSGFFLSKVVAEFISPKAAQEEKVSDIGEEYSDFKDVDFIEKMNLGQYDTSDINSPTITADEITHMKKYGAKSILYIPLRSKEKLIGFTELWESRAVREYTSSEIKLCQDISTQAAIALENARLYKQISDSLAEKNVLLQEIHHRVKNNLQIISSLLNLQSGRIDDPDMLEIFADSRNRIKSIALVHETLYGSDDLSQVDLEIFLSGLLKNIFQIYPDMSTKISINTQIDAIFLSPDKAVPLGLVLNELITNSMKHAFPEQNKGRIDIKIEKKNSDGLSLIIGDTGIGLPGGSFSFSDSQSLGLSLVNILVKQLKGEIEFIEGKGTTFKISIP